MYFGFQHVKRFHPDSQTILVTRQVCGTMEIDQQVVGTRRGGYFPEKLITEMSTTHLQLPVRRWSWKEHQTLCAALKAGDTYVWFLKRAKNHERK
jgi:hypothetical protein